MKKLLLLSLVAIASTGFAKDSENTNWDQTKEEIINQKHFKKSSEDPEEDVGRGTEALYKVFGALEQLRIKFTLKQTIDLFDGLGLKLSHSQDIDNAFYGNYFSRMDGYDIGLQTKILELVGITSDFGLAINPTLRVKMYQFFESKKEAANPKNIYLPSRIPFKADDVKKKLKPGDMVVFDGDLNIAYGYYKFWDKITDWIKLKFGAQGIINGRIRFFLFRANGDIVRLRVSAYRGTPKVISARLSIFDLFDLGWGKLTELVEDALNLDSLFKGELRKVEDDLFIADYTLDLGDLRVRSAYDHIFDRNNRVRAMSEAANPFLSREKLQDKLWERLKPVTEIAVGEQNKANPAAVVNFLGTNFSKGGFLDTEAGVRGIWRGELRRTKKNNLLMQRLYDDDQRPFNKYYFFPSWVRKSSKAAGAGLNKERKHRAANIIYRTDSVDPDYNIIGFESIGFYREETDKKYSYSEHKKIMDSLKAVLPESTFTDFENYLEFKNWGEYSGFRQNARVSARYFITADGLKRMERVGLEEVKKAIVKTLAKMDSRTGQFVFADKMRGSVVQTRELCPLDELRSLGAKTYKGRKRGNKTYYRLDLEDGGYLGEFTFEYCKKINKLANVLQLALDPDLDANARHNEFSSLSRNKLFQKIAGGVIFEILGKGDRRLNEEVTFFEFVINVSGQPEPVRFTRGQIENRPLYEIILQMERIQNEELPDLRLPGRSENLIRKIYDNDSLIQMLQ